MKTIEKKAKKVPAIRFAGFEDEWVEKKLGDVAGVYDGVHQTPDYRNSGVMFLSVENISSLKSEKYISQDAFEKNYKVYPQKGDVLMTRIGDVGTPNVVESDEKIAYYVSLALLKPFDVDSYFLNDVIQSKTFQKRMKERTLLTAIPMKINKDEIGKVGIIYPIRKNEQRKIGSFFSNIDSLISLEQKKYDKLTQVKKSMLEKMFPKEGATVPEIRFANFTGEWEKKKLGNIGIVIDPHPSHRAPKEEPGGIPFIGIGDVDAMGVINRKTARPVSPLVYEDHHKRYDLSLPSLGLARVASLGKVIRLRADVGKYAVSPTMSVIQFNKTVDVDYVYSFMSTPIFQKQFEGKSNGSTRQSVGTEMVRILDVNIPPNIKEQNKIGSYFSHLDSLISLQQRKLEKLKNIKKSLLEKMFV